MKASSIMLSLLLSASFAAAELSVVPTLMSYQGRVTDSAGVLIGNASPVNRAVTFRLYTVSTGGTPIWAETQNATISAGEFSVLIGNGTGLSGVPGAVAPAAQPYRTVSQVINGLVATDPFPPVFLGVTVDDGNSSTVDPEISPRQQIVSGVYAMRAKVAESVASAAITSTMINPGAVTTDAILAGAVNNAKLADLSVSTGKVTDGAIITGKLADASVTTAKLVNGSVTTDKILDGTIATADHADSSITSVKITDGTITSADIGDGQVGNIDLAGSSVDISKLVAAVKNALCPPGTIVAFGGNSLPNGWLWCDGTMYNRNDKADLFSAIGTSFGYGDSSNFAAPDFRGRFLRGKDAGVGRDDDRATREAMQSGGATGDAVGSVQNDSFKRHKHTVPSDSAGGNVDQNSLYGSAGSDEGYSSTPGTGEEGGSETRPENANVNYIIKY